MIQDALGAQPDAAFHLRVLKGVVLDDLKWARWQQMITVTLAKVKKFASDPNEWFGQQLSITMQRILKGISIQQAGLDKNEKHRLHFRSLFAASQESNDILFQLPTIVHALG